MLNMKNINKKYCLQILKKKRGERENVFDELVPCCRYYVELAAPGRDR